MATKLERLEFAIGLRDQASGKIGQLHSALSRLTDTTKSQVETVATGVAGAAGSAYSLHKIVAPAIDLNRALGEVASLDVGHGALQDLQTRAEGFAMSYGGSAADVVRASYDIQSAIAGLSGQELGRFTVASGVLAKATKADVGTITSYMGTMYGIFHRSADGMGKSAWVEQIAGQTATAVKMFKTTGAEMSAAFTSLGANATAAGLGAAEQMAVLGRLQATMSGSEAGTKYKAFLAGVGNAQRQLGLQFTDAQGNMLGMVEILEKLRGRFGDSLDVAEGDALKAAFGSDEAVSLVKLLLADTQGLAANIDAIGQAQGLDAATDMAAHMSDVWARLGGTVSVLATAFGQKLLPPLEALVGLGISVLQTFVGWTHSFPNLTRWVGYGVIAAVAMAGAVSLLSASIAIGKLAMLGFGGPLKLLLGTLGLLTKATGLQTAAQWLLNSAILANPMTWVVLGILSLIAVLGDCLGWWDQLKAALGDTTWGNVLIETILAVLAPFRTLYKAVSGVWGLLFPDNAPTEESGAPATTAALQQPAPVDAALQAQPLATSAPQPPAMLTQARTSTAPTGGLLRETTTQINRGSNRQTHIGSVTINATKPMTPAELGDEWALQAG